MRVKKEWIIGGSLELLALTLANWQALGGIRTDEAKYLLTIPYPHPPLMRWLMSATEWLPQQEMLWRVLLATLMVQAVWLVWDMARSFHQEDRMMVCAGWLLSAAVLIQAGSITMAPIMALQTLVFLWLRLRPDIVMKRPTFVGIWWLITIFTSYPGILLLPLAWDVLSRAGCTLREKVILILGPFALLILYTLTNPLALAIMVVHRDEGIRTTLMARAMGFAKLWLVGGSGIGSLVGTWGIIRRGKDRPLILTGILVSAFVFFSITPLYYAILFTPLFVGGIWNVFHARQHPHAFPLLGSLLFACAIITWFVQPARVSGPARNVMEAISDSGTGSILIAGPFGHEWQYESRSPVRRYRPEFVRDAKAVVCLNACEPMFDTTGWRRIDGVPVETWVRK